MVLGVCSPVLLACTLAWGEAAREVQFCRPSHLAGPMVSSICFLVLQSCKEALAQGRLVEWFCMHLVLDLLQRESQTCCLCLLSCRWPWAQARLRGQSYKQ